jgi:polyribonucleotide nucleotidyltransferase
MMDAGVPLRSAVAGIAMGLILGETAEEEPVVLTDILGLEDALGTMDFKVAGSRDGISSFQLDIKSEGLTMAVLRNALEQAREGRLAILDTMDAHLPAARDLCEQVPKILTFSVPPPSIGKIIGPKGKTIQGLIETHELVNINLNDEGTVQVESYNSTRNAEVQTIIEAMVKEVKDGGKGAGRGGSDDKSKVPAGPPPEQGLVYKDCPIKGVHNFGVFVEIVPGHEGLVHISELDSKRVSSPEEAGYAVGQNLDVKVLGRNDKGQWRLSRKALLLRENDEKEKESKSIAQPPVAASSQKAEENWR